MHVLLTGATGYVAAHLIQTLLAHGHSVVGTVRSTTSPRVSSLQTVFADAITKKRLTLAVVKDMAAPGAFDESLKSFGPFDAVAHTASPASWFNIKDIQAELIDPAINGSVGLLKSVHEHAPSVKRVVITGSFASMGDLDSQGNRPGHTFTETDWSALTKEQALGDAFSGYRYAKLASERQAWKYMNDAKPSFSLSVLPSPAVIGPSAVPPEGGVAGLPLGVQMVSAGLQGAWKERVPDTMFTTWIDVRDLAEAHVRGLERESAGGQRIWPVSDEYFSNRVLADVVRSKFPEYESVISAEGGALPEDMFKIGNEKSKKLLGMSYMSFETTIIDLVKDLKTIQG